MKKILFASIVGLMAFNAWDDAGAYCIRPATGFYNPNCITQAQADQLAYQQPGYSPNNTARILAPFFGDAGNSPSNDRAASAVTTRNYALGSEPRRGQPGTQSLPRGLTELSRRQMSQALSRRTQLTGPAVHTDPVTGEKTLRSVEITYGIPAGPDHRGNDSRTSYNNNMGGTGRSHQGM